MADQAKELMSAPATSGDELAAGASPPPAPSPQSSIAHASPAPAPSPVEPEKESKRKAKKERDAKRAQVRRRLEDLENAGSVEELEAKLLGRLKPAAAALAPASNVVPITAAIAAAAATPGAAAAPGVRPPPTPEQIRAWREATEQVLGGLNKMAKAALSDTPYPLSEEELAELCKTAPPVLAKYLPEVLVSPELVLASTILGIAIPRALFALKLGPYAEQQLQSAEATPAGKAAA